MVQAIVPWEAKRTPETRSVEDALRRGFEQVDAYRYNSAAIRLRVIDPRFEKLSPAERDAMVEPFLAQLPERTQADIITLFTFAPTELEPNETMSRSRWLDLEFKDPSPSML